MAAVVTLIATADFPYNGRSLHPGDRFDAVSERDAQTLRLLRKAEDAPRVKRAYRRRDLVPEA